MKNSLDVKTVALNRAIQILDSLGTRYKIITAEGAEYGALEAVEPKGRSRAPSKYPHGAVRSYLRSHMGDTKMGEVAIIPVGEFDLTTLQAGASSLAADVWGPGASITRMDKEANHLEVLRVF